MFATVSVCLSIRPSRTLNSPMMTILTEYESQTVSNFFEQLTFELFLKLLEV